MKRAREAIRAERTKGATNWKRLDALSDGAIRKAVASEPDAAPIAGADWFRRAKIVLPQPNGHLPSSIRNA